MNDTPLTIAFHDARPGDLAFACSALFVMGAQYFLTAGFVLARSRNAACARWVKACRKKDASLKSAEPVEVIAHEIAEHAAA